MFLLLGKERLMKLSTKARYAVQIITHVAVHQKDGPVRKHSISSHENVSADYVEQILVSLRNAGLVNSHRGAKGGFSTAKPASEITVMDVIQATDGPLSLGPKPDQLPEKPSPGSCITRPIWTHASQMLINSFESITIKDLSEKYEQQQNQAIDYQI